MMSPRLPTRTRNGGVKKALPGLESASTWLMCSVLGMIGGAGSVDTTRSENDHGMARGGFMMVNIFLDVYIAILCLVYSVLDNHDVIPQLDDFSLFLNVVCL